MTLDIRIRKKKDTLSPSFYLFSKKNSLKKVLSETALKNLPSDADKKKVIRIVEQNQIVYLLPLKEHADKSIFKENLRKSGYDLWNLIESENIEEFQLIHTEDEEKEILPFLEGLLLSSYRFDKYKSDKKNTTTHLLYLVHPKFSEAALQELKNLTDAVFIGRDLVNEPVVYLTAEQLSEEIIRLGNEAGFTTEILYKKQIESLRMGGLLAVNAGSELPPTFSILHYQPLKPVNKKPIVLIGKGVVYDTGGLSLKPTPGSMDMMKCDMAGAAAVIAVLYALAKNDIPVHVVGLIPATDNRPGGNAITPGDVITMHNGKTVEILNTDAEGRLILADALSYANRYNPDIVIDLATLTGAAARAIGKEGAVYMGTASSKVKATLEKSGEQVYERLVEFPLWEEYDAYIQSDIADIKNVGGEGAGAITAGKFLEHFATFPWLHLDIAGTAFLTAPDNYRGKNGTGTGIRLLYQFITNHYL